jgi:hypothetical protein
MATSLTDKNGNAAPSQYIHDGSCQSRQCMDARHVNMLCHKVITGYKKGVFIP